MIPDDLLFRLSAATGPSRELDAEIALANGWTRYPRENGGYEWRSPTGQICPHPPRYTESVELVLRDLMPPDPPDMFWHICLERFSDGWAAYIEWRATIRAPVIKGPRYYVSQCSAPAIALVIAFRQAKEASKP